MGLYRIDTVSYTHLDVYKRQAVDLAVLRYIDIKIGQKLPAVPTFYLMDGVSPVSYTHLDVYKRQS